MKEKSKTKQEHNHKNIKCEYCGKSSSLFKHFMLENKEGNSDIVIFYYILQNLEQL